MSNPSPAAVATPLNQAPALRSITFERGDLQLDTGLLDFVVRSDVHTWIRRGGGIVAFGETARFTTSGPGRFAEAQAWWREVVAAADVVDPLAQPGSGLVAFGSFAFSKTSRHLSRLIVPRILVGSREGKSWITYITDDDRAELSASAAEAELAAYLDEVEPERKPCSGDRIAPGILTEEQWMTAVSRGVAHIRKVS